MRESGTGREPEGGVDMGIVRKLERMDRVKVIAGDFPVRYVYTVPEHLERFFMELKEKGSFTGARCGKCKTVYVPPVHFCEKCFVRVKDAVAVADNGTLQAFTVARQGPEGEPLETPVVYGIVKLRGASTVILHKVLADPAKLKTGIRVRAQLKPQNKRRGSMTDIEGFVPV
jgi:uncharacterized OB-fold protein